jgi:hypothetical protein
MVLDILTQMKLTKTKHTDAMDVAMNDIEKLQEISRLLDEAYKHYFSYEGHCKSSEGWISVNYGNYWDRYDNPSEMPIKGVEIYSYVFCEQGRSQDFDSLDEALETVRDWHAKEMAYDYNAPEEVAAREEMDQFAAEWLQEMQASGKLEVHIIGNEDD